MSVAPKSRFLWLLWEDKTGSRQTKTCFKNGLFGRLWKDRTESEWGGQG